MINLFKSKKFAAFMPNDSATTEKKAEDVSTMIKQKEILVLAYRTNDDLRTVCRQEIETLEHWARRIVHEILSENYGKDYISYKNENAEPLIRGEIKTRIDTMCANDPGRFPRPIDAMFLGDITYVLCKNSLYDSHFRPALIDVYPQGNEEARTFLNRIEAIRNKLSHANPISVREAEQTICYCHDFIDGIKKYYKEIGKEKDYNVPTFISATDSLGNSFLASEGVGPLKRCIDYSKPVRGCDIDIKLRAGDLYSIEIVVDPAFDSSQYTICWTVESGLTGKNYKNHWENTAKIDIPIGVKTVGSSLEIKCILTSKKDWHKHNWYDDMFEFNIYTILPPIEDNY